MPSLSRNWRRGLWFVAQVVGLFAVFYFYVLLRVRPELFYQQNPDVFLFDSAFLAAFVDQPGGLVEYASAFLSPLFAFGWLGALVVTLLAAFICLATRRFVAAIAGTGGAAVCLIPALLILMVLGQYNHPVSLCVGLCVVLGLASAYVRIGQGHSAVRLTAFVIASALAYYAAAGLYVVFAVLCGIFEWRIRRHRWLGAWCALSAVVVPMAAGVWLCDLSIPEAYRGTPAPDGTILARRAVIGVRQPGDPGRAAAVLSGRSPGSSMALQSRGARVGRPMLRGDDGPGSRATCSAWLSSRRR